MTDYYVRPTFVTFGGGITVVDSNPDTPTTTADDHASEGEDVTAERENVRDDTPEFERVEVRVFERYLRRFGRFLDYWIWSGDYRG